MAIIQSALKINDIDYVYSKSDDNRYICRDGYRFEDAYDKVSFGRAYTEGDPIVPDLSAEDALNILLGGE